MNKDSYHIPHRTATVERFSPTHLAHAIAAQTHHDTKAMARAKPYTFIL